MIVDKRWTWRLEKTKSLLIWGEKTAAGEKKGAKPKANRVNGGDFGY